MSSLPKACFNYDSLQVIVGNTYKGFKTLQCVKVPTYTKQKLQRSDEGNGWYGPKEKMTVTYDKVFIILEEGKPFGVLLEPYYQPNIQSNVYPLNHNFHKEVIDFIKTL
jgi:hypothetical protein